MITDFKMMTHGLHADLAGRMRAGMRFGRRWVVMVSALVLCGVSGPVAADAGPEDVVRSTIARLLAAVAEQPDAVKADHAIAYGLVRSIVSPNVDYAHMSRWILGKHYRRANADQKERFSRELESMLIRTYATALYDFAAADHTITGTRPGRRSSEVMVRTEVPRAGQMVNIDYRLYRKDGVWKFYDVVIEGVSLVATYRTSFNTAVKRVGMEGLIAQMAKKNS